MYSDYDTTLTKYVLTTKDINLLVEEPVFYNLKEIDLLKILDMTGKRAFGSW